MQTVMVRRSALAYWYNAVACHGIKKAKKFILLTPLSKKSANTMPMALPF